MILLLQIEFLCKFIERILYSFEEVKGGVFNNFLYFFYVICYIKVFANIDNLVNIKDAIIKIYEQIRDLMFFMY